MLNKLFPRRSTAAHQELLQDQRSGKAHNDYKLTMARERAVREALRKEKSEEKETPKDKRAGNGYYKFMRLLQRAGV